MRYRLSEHRASVQAWRSRLLLLGLLVALPLGAAEPAVAPTEVQIKEWIKKLGDEDFAVRAGARESLLKAGKSAVELLKAVQSPDMEIQNSVRGILAKIRWQTLPDQVNYLAAFPAESIAAGYVPQVKAIFEGARNTALGRLLFSEPFKPLLAMVEQKRQGDDDFRTFMEWLNRFQGSAGFSVWSFNPMDPTKMGAAAILELPADGAETHYKNFLQVTGADRELQPQVAEGLTILVAPNGMGAFSLVGRHMILGANQDSVLRVANGLAGSTAGGLKDSASLKRALAGFAPDPAVTMVVSVPAYMTMVKGMMAMMPVGGMAQMLEKSGAEAYDLFVLSTSFAQGQVEDRVVLTFKDGQMQPAYKELLEMQWKSKMPLAEVFGLVPRGAVAVGNSYLEGKPVLAFYLEFAKVLLDFQAQMAAMAGQPGPAKGADEFIKELESGSGVALSGLAACIEGDLAWWCSLNQGLAVPDLGLVLSSPDAAKAGQLAEDLRKVSNSLAKLLTKKESPAVEKQVKGAWTVFTESEDSPLVADPERKKVPYRLSWGVSGRRLVFASSVAALQARLNGLANKEPGFDPKPHLGEVGVEPQNAMIVDLKQLLRLGVEHGLPLLQAETVGQPELNAALKKLAEAKGLFDGVPPLTATAAAPKDGRMVVTFRSPTGLVGSYAIAVGAMFFSIRAHAEGAVVAPAIGGAGGF